MKWIVRVAALAAVLVLACAPGARAQSWEASVLSGFTPSVNLERHAREVDNVAVSGAVTWTLQLTRFLTPHWGAQVQWGLQPSSLDLTVSGATAELFSMTTSQLHGDVVYRFASADARTQPFVFGGLGATFFQSEDLVTETKLSLGVGGGVKVFLWRAIGLVGQLRYKPTFLNDESSDYCDPFGFCQATLQQFDFGGGVVLRF
jgi:hypothetical protein